MVLGVTGDDLAEVQRRVEGVLASPDLPGIENLLFDRVAISTPAGGEVLERAAAAQWLRDRAGSGVRVLSVERNALSVALRVATDGWPQRDPMPTGQLALTFHRFAPDGQQDQEMGEWKVDVLTAE